MVRMHGLRSRGRTGGYIVVPPTVLPLDVARMIEHDSGPPPVPPPEKVYAHGKHLRCWYCGDTGNRLKIDIDSMLCRRKKACQERHDEQERINRRDV